ncbi:MAG: tRNA (adenosine(37)-N6)-dimethylallyltransferase MiaA [Alphaproteobacteria bacterium]|jgi:tRNA dimethylallyltransferase|nr:tRNA (adenosine(37)-N6)-dimethylallyltransferase MiaA [Alphaproteobacteria bacterium]
MIDIKQLNPQKDVLVIFGATASGKSAAGVDIARQTNGVIINADASQIYKEAPILANLPTARDFAAADHKLFAYLSITEESSVASWLKLCAHEIESAQTKGKIPIVVGGSGMYISALLYGISDIPSQSTKKQEAIATYNQLGAEKFLELMQKIDPIHTAKDSQRLIRAYEVYLITQKPFSFYASQPKIKYVNAEFINIFINPVREDLYAKINLRTESMFKEGVVEEAARILKLTQQQTHIKKILGLSEIINYLDGKQTLENTISLVQQKTRNYAKRQITWFNHQIAEKIIRI